MADTSERIIILTAVLLAVIFIRSTQMYQVEPINEIEDTVLTWKDMQIQIATSRDIYTLGDRFTATVYLVNNRSEEVKVKPVYSCSIGGGVNRTDGIGKYTSWTYPPDIIITLPPNSKTKLDGASFTPKQTGAFVIESMGVEKTVLILEQGSAWIKALVLTGAPSPNLHIVDISSEDEDIPRSMFKAIDKALLDHESVQEGGLSDFPHESRRFAIPIDEAESIIHYFGTEIEGRNAYEFYVGFLDYVISILIQFSIQVTS
jgi:hypothetical protein